MSFCVSRCNNEFSPGGHSKQQSTRGKGCKGVGGEGFGSVYIFGIFGQRGEDNS